MIGVQGNEAAQARVFAHDATVVVTDARVLWLELDTLKQKRHHRYQRLELGSPKYFLSQPLSLPQLK